MTLKQLAATPTSLTLGDGVWSIKFDATGCAAIVLSGGWVHECDVQKVAALLLEARAMAGRYFGKGFAG